MFIYCSFEYIKAHVFIHLSEIWGSKKLSRDSSYWIFSPSYRSVIGFAGTEIFNVICEREILSKNEILQVCIPLYTPTFTL